MMGCWASESDTRAEGGGPLTVPPCLGHRSWAGSLYIGPPAHRPTYLDEVGV